MLSGNARSRVTVGSLCSPYAVSLLHEVFRTAFPSSAPIAACFARQQDVFLRVCVMQIIRHIALACPAVAITDAFMFHVQKCSAVVRAAIAAGEPLSAHVRRTICDHPLGRPSMHSGAQTHRIQLSDKIRLEQATNLVRTLTQYESPARTSFARGVAYAAVCKTCSALCSHTTNLTGCVGYRNVSVTGIHLGSRQNGALVCGGRMRFYSLVGYGLVTHDNCRVLLCPLCLSKVSNLVFRVDSPVPGCALCLPA